jgi:MULE transposase domain
MTKIRLEIFIGRMHKWLLIMHNLETLFLTRHMVQINNIDPLESLLVLTVIFEAILLYDQSIESFQWVFHTFLKSHNNKKLKTIFTDQDAAMGIAIANMMPDVSHGLCTWHISKNATKHLISHNDDEMDCVRTCIFGYED